MLRLDAPGYFGCILASSAWQSKKNPVATGATSSTNFVTAPSRNLLRLVARALIGAAYDHGCNCWKTSGTAKTYCCNDHIWGSCNLIMFLPTMKCNNCFELATLEMHPWPVQLQSSASWSRQFDYGQHSQKRRRRDYRANDVDQKVIST